MMSYEAMWLIEGRVILHKHSGLLNLDDIGSIGSITVDMLSNVDVKIHIVSDLTEVTGVHPNFNNVKELTKISRELMVHPNLGKFIPFGSDNKVLNFLGSVLFQISKKEWKWANDYDSAVKILIRTDPSLEAELENL